MQTFWMDRNNQWLSGECRPFSVIQTNIGCNSRRIHWATTKSIPTKLLQRRQNLLLLLPLILSIISVCDFSFAQEVPSELPSPLSLNHDTDPAKEVSMCEACHLIVSSFDKGLDETARGKHEGGDTSWEERNLKSYQDSEVRLIEIQEMLCEDVKGPGKAQCLSLAEDTESDVEEWWFKQRHKNVRLFDYLCISKLKRCCPPNSFGPTCQPCEVDCSKHGTCDGAGTRGGTGKCDCDSGYIGTNCDNCDDNHFRIATSDDFACRKCDSACRGCYGPGQTNCTNCREGYYKHDVNGCIDIDECDIGTYYEEGRALCSGNKYCINTDGSYRCADCHVSCSGCVAYGIDMCNECAPGYQMDEHDQCRTKEEIEKFNGMDYVETARHGKNTLSLYIFYAVMLYISVMVIRSRSYMAYAGLLLFIVVHVANLMSDNVNFGTTLHIKL